MARKKSSNSAPAAEVVEVLACPCCGEARIADGAADADGNLYGLSIGFVGADRLGVQCHTCGLTLARSYPAASLYDLDGFYFAARHVRLCRQALFQAVAAWNRRPAYSEADGPPPSLYMPLD